MNEIANGMQCSKMQHQVMDAQGCAVLIVNGRFNASFASCVGCSCEEIGEREGCG
jgi:hypothetical protein